LRGVHTRRQKCEFNLKNAKSLKGESEIKVPLLIGQRIQLEPLEERHRGELRAAADDDRIWENMLVLARGPGFDAWFDASISEREAGGRIPFAVRRKGDGVLVGSTSFLDPSLRHKRIEIGSTWYIPDVWGTAVNPECKLLLMQHAFEVLGVNRVEFCTDARNKRSQAAIAKLGAVMEGVRRSHMVTRNNRIRDTVTFSVIAPEWPGVKAALVARVADGGI
jgi:RimJ/RimL family protein N-acetyltransferase